MQYAVLSEGNANIHVRTSPIFQKNWRRLEYAYFWIDQFVYTHAFRDFLD